MTAAMTATTALLAASSSNSSSGGSSTFLIFIVLIAVVGYFLLVRPQRQRQRRQREQQSAVSVGDEVLTVGGIVGRVVAVDADRVTVIVGADTVGFPAAGSEPTRLVFVRNAISKKLEPSTPSPDATGETSEGETAATDYSSNGSNGHVDVDDEPPVTGTARPGAESAESEGASS